MNNTDTLVQMIMTNGDRITNMVGAVEKLATTMSVLADTIIRQKERIESLESVVASLLKSRIPTVSGN